MARLPRRGLVALLTGSCCGLSLCGCSDQAHTQRVGTQRPGRTAIERYINEVEPIRLGVNKLLGGADPTLSRLAKRRIPQGEAARRIGALERRFASYAIQIAAVSPSSTQLRALNSSYADTYVLEDSYLSALAAGIASGNLDDLPNTQSEQRAAIIRWRTELTVLANAADAPLPADLQQAGRGEIAPSPHGS